MLTEPEHITLDEVRNAVHENYGVALGALHFVPLGEDSWNYRAPEVWISVRRDLRGHRPDAYRLARALADAQMDFVVAPMRTRTGAVVAKIVNHPLVVFPEIIGSPVGDSLTTSEREQVVGMLRRVHGWERPTRLPIEDFELPFLQTLRASLEWTHGGEPPSGPFSERLRTRLGEFAPRIKVLIDETLNLAQQCRRDHTPFSITHGDISVDNVLRSAGRLLLIDWGSAAWAPVERDWYHLARAFGSGPSGRPQFMRFYRNKWVLSEIDEYATVLRRFHSGSIDDHAMWIRLLTWLEAARA